jgi:hypothetical protein
MPTPSPRRSSAPETAIRCPATRPSWKRPEADNLVGIYAALAGKTKAEALAEFGGAQFSTFKKSRRSDGVGLSSVNAEMNRLLADPAEIDRVLAGREQGARHRGSIVETAKDIVGFLRFYRFASRPLHPPDDARGAAFTRTETAQIGTASRDGSASD